MSNEPESTRKSLHAVAELVLAGPQHAATGQIRLRVADGGLGTRFGDEVRLEGGSVIRGDLRAQVDGRTPAELAGELGLTAQDLAHVYTDGPDRDLGQRLQVDPASTKRLLATLSAGDAALRAFAPGEDPVVWPEHFDVGISVDKVNYGVSPGDGFEAEPYAYVGPWTPPEQDDFWNAPFGAVLRLPAGTGADEVRAFFERGRERLG